MEKKTTAQLKKLADTLRDLASDARDDSDSIEAALAAESAYVRAAELVEELLKKF